MDYYFFPAWLQSYVLFFRKTEKNSDYFSTVFPHHINQLLAFSRQFHPVALLVDEFEINTVVNTIILESVRTLSFSTH